MFFANVAIAEKYNYLEEKFTRAYKWLKETDIAALSEGSYPIGENDVVANVQEYTTIDPKDGEFETHDKFFDIQYIVSGREKFGLCKRDGLKVKTVIEERDLVFYEDPELCGEVLLLEGDFIVVAPEDAHKPRLNAGEPCEVKKVVVKVRI
jgi:YhcH/YjgK/YiaL family protein